MISLFHLLFSKRFWRTISLEAFWREVWLSLRRAHKDPRARKKLLQIFLVLIAPLFCVAYFVWIAASGGVFLIPFVIVAAWLVRRNRKHNQPLHITPSQQEPCSMPADYGNAAIREYLVQLAILYAVMTDRAGSESFLRNKHLPPNVEVISRRTHIDLLQRTGIWEKMSMTDRKATMIADGQWEPELITCASAGLEPLHLLRWILRIDFFLPAIGKDSIFNYGAAHEVVNNPRRILEANRLINKNDLDTARRAAEHYFYRCAAESISRGYQETVDDTAKTWADRVSRALTGKQGEDLLLGTHLVSEAGFEQLSQALMLARIRMNFLTWIEALLSGSTSPTLPFSFPAEPQAVSTLENSVGITSP